MMAVVRLSCHLLALNERENQKTVAAWAGPVASLSVTWKKPIDFQGNGDGGIRTHVSERSEDCPRTNFIPA